MTNDINKFIESTKKAIDAENAMSICCKRLTAMIKNGRIKKKFLDFSDSAKENREFLSNRLVSLGIKNLGPGCECNSCKVNPEEFSLNGALNLGLEITDKAVKFYKALSKLSKESEDKKLYKGLIKEKSEQKTYLKKEKKFYHENKKTCNAIDDFCIPHISSRLRSE